MALAHQALHASGRPSQHRVFTTPTHSRLHTAARRPAAAAAAAPAPARLPQQQQQRWRAAWPSSAVSEQQPAWICRSFLPASQAAPEPIPDDVQLQLNPDAAAKDVLYDEASKTVRIPLAALADGQRRTKMVMFTCNKCGGRSARLVNPLAWEKGAVFCQCQHCEVWHMLKADKSIVEEIRYNDPDWKLPEAQPLSAAAAAAAGGVAELAPDAGAEDSQQSSGTGLLGAALGPGADGEEEVSSR